MQRPIKHWSPNFLKKLENIGFSQCMIFDALAKIDITQIKEKNLFFKKKEATHTKKVFLYIYSNISYFESIFTSNFMGHICHHSIHNRWSQSTRIFLGFFGLGQISTCLCLWNVRFLDFMG